MNYGFLGPAGTFTQAALAQVLPQGAIELPQATVDAALAGVRAGELTAAMVPLENSVEGGVSATLDALATGTPLTISREVLLPVTFVLAATPGKPLSEITRIASHPHAWAQCRGWLADHLPQAHYVPALSTAAAATGLTRPDPGWDAALCAPLAAQQSELAILASNIGDNPRAVTRFVLVTRPGSPPPATGADKTSLVIFQRSDYPGGLLEMLEQFATRGINLTRIESRPTGESLGNYCFSIDCEGHIAQARVAEALTGLHRTCGQVRFLGSYPRADGKPSISTDTTSDAAFAAAQAWLDQLRGH